MKKLRISREVLQARKLFIATPMYGGQCFGSYTRAIQRLQAVMTANELIMQFFTLFNESAITRARNYCVHEFMQTECTHLLFIDADIEFTPDDALSLLTLSDPMSDKDVLAGLYPKKRIDWDKVGKAARKGKKDLDQFTGDLVLNTAGLSGSYDLHSPLEVTECGTGFMMIQRRVIERFAKVYPELAYTSDGRERPGLKPGRIVACFMDAIHDDRLLTEDFNFCRLIRNIGMRVWVAPWLRLNHLGHYKFIGNPEALSTLADTKETN